MMRGKLDRSVMEIDGVRYRLVRDEPEPIEEPIDPGCYLIERQDGSFELWVRCGGGASHARWMCCAPFRECIWMPFLHINPRRIQRVEPGDVEWRSET